jgi:hypothetical protein
MSERCPHFASVASAQPFPALSHSLRSAIPFLSGVLCKGDLSKFSDTWRRGPPTRNAAAVRKPLRTLQPRLDFSFCRFSAQRACPLCRSSCVYALIKLRSHSPAQSGSGILFQRSKSDFVLHDDRFARLPHWHAKAVPGRDHVLTDSLQHARRLQLSCPSYTAPPLLLTSTIAYISFFIHWSSSLLGEWPFPIPAPAGQSGIQMAYLLQIGLLRAQCPWSRNRDPGCFLHSTPVAYST